MRTLTVAAFISLDGVMQAPGGPEEDPSGGFRFGGWIVPYADKTTGQAVQDLFSQPFELLLGRRTYDIFASYWPRIQPDSTNRTLADLFNGVPKHVATHRADSLDWQNSHALQGNLIEAIGALKRQDGPRLLTQGSGDLVRQLLAAGLVDELQLMIHPITPSLTCSTPSPSMWPPIAPTHWPGTTVMRWKATWSTRSVRSSTRTALIY